MVVHCVHIWSLLHFQLSTVHLFLRSRPRSPLSWIVGSSGSSLAGSTTRSRSTRRTSSDRCWTLDKDENKYKESESTKGFAKGFPTTLFCSSLNNNKGNTKIFCRQSKSFLFRSPSCSRCLWQTSACARCSNHCDFARLWLRLRLWPMVFLSRTTGWGRLRLSISMGHLMGRRDSRQVWIIAIPAKCEIPFTQ